MTVKLDDEAGIAFQLLIWHYALTGNMADPTAAIAQGHNVEDLIPDAWDRTSAWLDTMRVAYGDEPYRRPPERWCLPAVTDLIIQRTIAGSNA